MISNIRLSSPDMGEEELKYIIEALDSNWVAPVGENIDKFEKSLENYLDSGVHVVALNSGTTALHLALILAGVKNGDEVICQSLTFAASAFPILYQGGKPVFIDSEKDTWNMCPQHLEEAIVERIKRGKNPKAIIVVHIFGMPAKMEEIMRISKKYNIPVIEDAAEALGSEFQGTKCGTIGDFGILSFNGNKIITTSGGGALVCTRKEQKEKTIFLASQAKDNFDWYEHSEIGYNYRLSNILAGIGRGQMKVISRHIQKRRENNYFYKQLFKPFPFIQVFGEKIEGAFSNHWLTCVQFDTDKTSKTVKGLKDYLWQYKIESKYIWKPLHLQPVFKNCLFFGKNVAEKIFENGLCLPSGSNLTDSEKELIAKAVLEYLNNKVENLCKSN